jgi:ankyrin repeat protein
MRSTDARRPVPRALVGLVAVLLPVLAAAQANPPAAPRAGSPPPASAGTQPPAAALPANASPAQQALVQSVRRDDPHGVRTALLRGADANLPDANGEPPIVFAGRNKAWQAVRALAELRGTRLDATNASDTNVLMYAALSGELELVRWLVGRKAEVNKTGWAPLHMAAANGHLDVVRYLLEQHAYIDAESPNGTTPLMMAARNGFPSVARFLVEEGADPTPRNQHGLDAATYARTAAKDDEFAAWLQQRADAYRRKYGVGTAKP